MPERRLLFDKKPLAILACKPTRRPAAAAPRFVGLRIAILGRQRLLACYRTLAREAEFLGGNAVFGDFLLDVGDCLRDFFIARMRHVLMKLFKLRGQLLIGGHRDSSPFMSSTAL